MTLSLVKREHKDLAKESRAIEYIILPTIKMLKIAVKLNVSGGGDKRERVSHKRRFKKIELDSRVKEISLYLRSIYL